MNSINTYRPQGYRVHGYPLPTPTAECRICGERTDLNGSDSICSLCHRLLAEAESDLSHKSILNGLFFGSEATPFFDHTVKGLEEAFADDNEEDLMTNVDEPDAYTGNGIIYPPSDKYSGTDDCADPDFELEAVLWIRVHIHLTVRNRQQK